MDELRLRNLQAVPVKEDVRALLGSLANADLLDSLIARGFGWHFDVGAFSTPIVGGGNGTVLDIQQPEFCISVPIGFTVIPVRLDVAVAVPVQTTDAHETEILIAADRISKWAGDGTVVAETPTNMRTDIATTCPATCFSAATVNITLPVLGVELAHELLTMNFGTNVGLENQRLHCLYEPKTPPFLVGPCAIYGYAGGSIASSVFANLDFIVIPSALLTSLV